MQEADLVVAVSSISRTRATIGQRSVASRTGQIELLAIVEHCATNRSPAPCCFGIPTKLAGPLPIAGRKRSAYMLSVHLFVCRPNGKQATMAGPHKSEELRETLRRPNDDSIRCWIFIKQRRSTSMSLRMIIKSLREARKRSAACCYASKWLRKQVIACLEAHQTVLIKIVPAVYA